MKVPGTRRDGKPSSAGDWRVLHVKVMSPSSENLFSTPPKSLYLKRYIKFQRLARLSL